MVSIVRHYGTSSREFLKDWKSRKMLSLQRNTHRYFLEPLAEIPHIQNACRIDSPCLLLAGFVANGNKKVLRSMLDVIKSDLHSITEKNLRCIKLRTENLDLKNLDIYTVPYNEVPRYEAW